MEKIYAIPARQAASTLVSFEARAIGKGKFVIDTGTTLQTILSGEQLYTTNHPYDDYVMFGRNKWLLLKTYNNLFPGKIAIPLDIPIVELCVYQRCT
jgi:hypothetical protein